MGQGLLAGTAPDLGRRSLRLNFLMDGQEQVKASYRGNYERLAQIKQRYDPDNTFHINQNIQPASEPGR